MVASQVHDRFPTYESMVNANLLLPHEKERLESIDKTTPHETTFIPIMWAVNLIHKGEKDGKLQIKAPVYANLISAFDYLEDRNRSLFNHGWINFPLAYTQVNTYLYRCNMYHKFILNIFTSHDIFCTYLCT